MDVQIKRYRKKPVEISAIHLPMGPGDSIEEYLELCLEIATWCEGESHMMAQPDERAFEGAIVVGPHIVIHTLEGDHAAQPGDWIIQGVEGEFYPCKDSIFGATYDPVTD